jgi:hypothetical protein
MRQIATTDITWEIVVADVDAVASELDFVRVERSQDQQSSKDGRLQIQVSRQAGGGSVDSEIISWKPSR